MHLINHGADLSKKTSHEDSALSLAALLDCYEIANLLLEKGVDVNEKTYLWETALQVACKNNSLKIVKILLKHGADINILTDDGFPILHQFFMKTNPVKNVLLKEFAQLKFLGKSIQTKNLEYINRNESALKYFTSCLEELKKMNNLKVYNTLTFYNILRMQNKKKIILLARNKSFVIAFKSSKIRKSFEYYSEDLDDVFKKILKVKNMLEIEEKKLSTVFKDLFPASIIRQIVNFLVEDSS